MLLNRGDGTFAAPVAHWPRGWPRQNVGDFDGDSKPDLVATNDKSVSVLLNAGSGTFAAEVVNKVANPAAEAAGDFDGDGKLDLALTDGATPGNVSVLLGCGH